MDMSKYIDDDENENEYDLNNYIGKE